MVKGFTVPTTVQTKDMEKGVIGAESFGGDESERLLEATAKQARVARHIVARFRT